MKFFITLSRKSLALVLAAVIIALIFTLRIFSEKTQFIDGSTNELRVNYLKSLKYAVDDSDVSSKEITIPQNFNDVYNEYNSLQKKSGFDLSKHKGKKATVYTYDISGSDRQIHIIVSDGKIIGGDVADIKINGEMDPIK